MKKSFRVTFLGINRDKSIEVYNNQEKDYYTLCTIL